MMLCIRTFAKRFALAFALVYGSAAAAGAAQRPDAWITTKVKMALLTDAGLESVRVNVDTIDGLVTLHGRVASDAAKAEAAQVAKKVDGVREVRNMLEVKPAGETDAKRAAVADDMLAKNVDAALKADRSLADSSIDVKSATDGRVLLGGKAATLSDHYRAIDVASRVDGVRSVASEIQSPDTIADDEMWHDSKPNDAMGQAQQRATDMWITSAAKVRLLATEGTTAFDTNVDTDDGTVTLFGKVDSPAAKSQAAEEVRKVEGVRNVVNALEVVAPENANRVENNDAALADVIEQRLERREALADGDVKVEVSNGVARLSGTVDSYGERLTALSLARSTLGVRRVIDDLKVQAPPAVSAR